MTQNVPSPLPTLVPESAPFSREQRSWLSGFFAGAECEFGKYADIWFSSEQFQSVDSGCYFHLHAGEFSEVSCGLPDSIRRGIYEQPGGGRA